MPAASFADSLPFILRWEGGYVNHPSDPGGATNRGVTQKVYDAWRRSASQPTQDVRQLSNEEMNAIYEANYWQPARCDVLERQLDLVQFDTAVNMGVGRATRFLQAAVQCQADGQFGSITLAAVQNCDVASTIASYCNQRQSYYDRLVAANPKLAVFSKGWSNRLQALRNAVGLPGFESAPRGLDESEPVQRVPDIGVDSGYDV